jgi:hypothetical protein
MPTESLLEYTIYIIPLEYLLHLSPSECDFWVIFCTVRGIWVLKQHRRRRTLCGGTKLDDSCLPTWSIWLRISQSLSLASCAVPIAFADPGRTSEVVTPPEILSRKASSCVFRASKARSHCTNKQHQSSIALLGEM